MRLLIVVTGVVLALAAPAAAGRDAEDLRRQIDAQRSGVSDFERLDLQRAVPDEIALLRTWLDEATNLLNEKEFDKVREVLDRCVAQAELLRQKIASAKLKAHLATRDEALRRSKDRVERTKAAILQAQATKKAMEMTAK